MLYAHVHAEVLHLHALNQCIGKCVGERDVPDLEKSGWLRRMNLSNLIYYERWGEAESESWSGLKELIKGVGTKNILY